MKISCDLKKILNPLCRATIQLSHLFGRKTKDTHLLFNCFIFTDNNFKEFNHNFAWYVISNCKNLLHFSSNFVANFNFTIFFFLCWLCFTCSTKFGSQFSQEIWYCCLSYLKKENIQISHRERIMQNIYIHF